MASALTPDFAFEESQVSPTISAIDSPRFFQEHGIFYVANSEIGQLVSELDEKVLSGDGFISSKPILSSDPRLWQILEPFLDRPPFLWFRLNNDRGNFFASTIDQVQDDRLLVYLCSDGWVLEFCDRSHRGPLKGVKASNGMVQIPYSSLRKRGFIDIKFHFEQGGIVVVHPRLALQVLEGFSHVYGLQRDDANPGATTS